MTPHVALLLLWAAQVALCGEPSPADVLSEPVYRCCRESALDEFRDAENIKTLGACREYCKSENLGQPVWRSVGWGCVADTLLHSCDEVEKGLCSDMVQAAKASLYRMYAASFSIQINTNTLRRRTSGGASSVRTIDDDTSDFTARVSGGISTGVRKRQGGSLTSILARSTADVNGTRTIGRVSHTNTPLLGPAFRGITFGKEGGVLIDRTVTVRRGNISVDRETDVTDKEKEKKKRKVALINGALTISSLNRGTERRQGRDIQNTASNSSVLDTKINTAGTVKLNIRGVLGAGASISAPSGSPRSALRSQGTSFSRTSGTRDRLVNFELDNRSRSSLLSIGDRIATTTTVDKSQGSETQVSNNNGSTRGLTDRTRVESGVGTIDTTNNRTTGNVNNRTQTERLEGGTSTITKTSSCPGCTSEQKEVIERGTRRNDDLSARSRFNVSGAFTVTAGRKGPRLHLRGLTGTSHNGTTLKRNEQGEERRTHGSSSKLGCKGKKRCNFTSNRKGVTITKSSNDSTVEDDVIVTTSKVSTATFKG
nr:adult cement protein 4 [Chelonibia testudinaria]